MERIFRHRICLPGGAALCGSGTMGEAEAKARGLISLTGDTAEHYVYNECECRWDYHGTHYPDGSFADAFGRKSQPAAAAQEG